MPADEVAGVAPQTDFSVVRVSQEFDNRSSLGSLVVNKEENGALVLSGHTNIVIQ